jgi:hypothetical protein
MKTLNTFLAISTIALSSNCFAFKNTAYVETNSNALKNVGCFVDATTNKPFFNTAVIFAANINGTDPNKPEIYLNSQDEDLLNNSKSVAILHKENIKVVAALLGNHQEAGWSTINNYPDATIFAKKLAAFVTKYDLDGIAIDDEYSTGSTNSESMLMIVRALKMLPEFKGKTVEKIILSGDSDVFSATYKGSKLADYLDTATPGYYPRSSISILPAYEAYGMPKISLYPSASTVYTSRSDAVNNAQQAVQGGWGGFMVFNVTSDSLDYLKAIYQAEYRGQSLKALPNCISS